MLSPDHVFSERGAISNIDYSGRFKQYKKFIVKNLDSPQMKALMARLNAQLFRTHSKNYGATPSTHEQVECEDEEMFSRAFREQVVIGRSILSLLSPYLIPRQDEGTAGVPAVITTPPSISAPTWSNPPAFPSNPQVAAPSLSFR